MKKYPFQNSLKKLTVERFSFSAPVEKSLSFAVLSDLHDCAPQPLLEKIRLLSPDAILIPGDLVHDSFRYENGYAFLEGAVRLAPVFLSVGNHEMKGERDHLSVFRAKGAVILDNESTLFRGVRIGGLTSGFQKGAKQSKFQKTPAPDAGFLSRFEKEEGYKILLCHHPEYYPLYLKDKKIDLILAGHAHGGQWRFFGRGVFAPGQGVFPHYTSGLYEKKLLVGRGLGNPVYVPRLFNAPEVIDLKLEPET